MTGGVVHMSTRRLTEREDTPMSRVAERALTPAARVKDSLSSHWIEKKHQSAANDFREDKFVAFLRHRPRKMKGRANPIQNRHFIRGWPKRDEETIFSAMIIVRKFWYSTLNTLQYTSVQFNFIVRFSFFFVSMYISSLAVLLLAAVPALASITCVTPGQMAIARWTNAKKESCTWTGTVGSNFGTDTVNGGEYAIFQSIDRAFPTLLT